MIYQCALSVEETGFFTGNFRSGRGRDVEHLSPQRYRLDGWGNDLLESQESDLLGEER